MAFLQNSNVLCYFPFASGTDGLREEIKGIEWLNGSNYTKPTTSGFLGSGVYSTYAGSSQCVVSGLRNPTYSGSTGTTSLTLAVWASGVGANSKFAAGWGASSNWHAIQLWEDGSNRLGMSYWYIDPPGSPSPFAGGVSPVCNNNGWTLLVARMEITTGGTYVSGSVSVNGGPWQFLGTRSYGSTVWQSANDTNVLIGWADRVGSETNQRPIDEFVVWQNAPRFTTQELQNLYDLGLTYRRPMPEYSNQYATAIKVSGYTTGYASGLGWLSSSRSAYVPGGLAASGQVTAYASGLGFIASSASGYVGNNVVWAEASGYVKNEGGSVTGWVSGYLHSQLVEKQVLAYVRGGLEHQRSLFLKTIPADNIATKTAMVYGSEDGSFAFALAQTSSIIYNATTAVPQSFGASLFLRGPEPAAQQSTFRWPLFLAGGNVANKSLGAFLRTCETLAGAVSTFIRGLGDPASEGFIPESSQFKLFCKTVPGTCQVMPAFLDGTAMPSGTCGACVVGIEGAWQSSGYAFVVGYNTSEKSLRAHIEAVLGLLAGQVNVQISGVCSPVTGVIPVYAHGF